MAIQPCLIWLVKVAENPFSNLIFRHIPNRNLDGTIHSHQQLAHMNHNIGIYRSRISILLWSIILIFLIGTFYVTSIPTITNPTLVNIGITLIVWIPTFTFILTILFGTRYILSSDTLTIKIGPVRHRVIKIQDLYNASRSYSLLASPANALRRLKLEYVDGEILISPVHESEFLRQLKKLNPKFMILLHLDSEI